MGGKGEEFTGTIIKDTWTITGRGGGNMREVGRSRVLGWVVGERQKTVLEQYNSKVFNN